MNSTNLVGWVAARWRAPGGSPGALGDECEVPHPPLGIKG